jgi:hypothetical protein
MIARRFTLMVLVSLCALGGGLAYGAGSAAAAVSQFGNQGEGAGQFIQAQGIAVDQATGDVYLLDKGNDRVDQFTSEGAFVMAWGEGVADGVTYAPQTCTTICFKGIPYKSKTEQSADGSGELGLGPIGVAVDNDPLSVSYQDVYVPESGNHRVEKFSSSGSFVSMFGKEVNENGTDVCVAGEKCRAGTEGSGDGEFNTMNGAIAVGPTGNVFVGDQERVQEFSPEGVFIASFAVASGFTRSLAVDDAGDLYVVTNGPASLREYDSSGALLRTLDAEGNPEAVTLDGSGDLFVEDNQETNHIQVHHMLEYGPGGEQLSSFDTEISNKLENEGQGDGLGNGDGIAFSKSLDMLYVIELNDVRLQALPVAGPELEGNGSVSGIEPLSATLNATVNPEGLATTYRFEYGLTTSYGSSVPVPEGSLPASFNEEPVSATLAKLTAGTTYHYRVVASDSKGHVVTGPDEIFTTQQAVLIDSVSATNVAGTSATLEAQLNPLGVDATYRLEYDTSEYVLGGPSHGTAAVEGSLGSGSGDVPVSIHVDGLQSGTVYHYRVVAHDTREGVAYTVDGPDETLTTQSVGGELGLPDARQWEMVSPADKKGAQVLAIGQYSGEGAVIEAAADGGAMTYMTAAPTEAEPQGYNNYEQVLSSRGLGGWGSRDISIPHETASGISIGKGEEYRFFTEDLSLSLVRPFGRFEPSLSGEASEETPFLRTDFLNSAADNPCVSSCFRPLVTGRAGYANVPAGTVFGEEGKCTTVVCGPQFLGATPDLKHVVLGSPAALTSTSIEGTRGESLYEWSGGSLALISVLPGGKAASSAALGYENSDARHAISDDGSRVVWSAGGHLYMSDVADVTKDGAVQLDTVQGGTSGGSAGAEFQIASSDGSRVVFTDRQPLTASSTVGKPDLYECEIVEEANELKCRLSDLTSSGTVGAGQVNGVVGASDDGSWVYFVAGTTLYVDHGGTTRTVAVLSSADKVDWDFQALPYMTARVSPDGRWLAFMSQRELTGYNTHDAVTGESDEEVYLYDADANGGAGKVVCASCDPTGARPVGIEYNKIGEGLAGAAGLWGSQRVAANIPGWTPNNLSNSRYQSRYLSDSGRLFFNSSDDLVPQDVNGTEDVYQYEPPGVGDCSSTSVSFGVRSGGCVGLISSGSSGEESGFMDASATGGDVFFVTTAKLSGVDRDTAVDIYDAHECTTGSPCLAVPPASLPVCDTGDSCKAAPSPQPPIFGSPSSATFSGAGNITQSVTKTVVKSKGLTRAQKLARALKVCRKERGKHRRAVCARRAKARYAKSGSLRVNASRRGGR